MAFYSIKQRGNFTSTASNSKTQAELTSELSAASETLESIRKAQGQKYG
jgi:hypothetical protein